MFAYDADVNSFPVEYELRIRLSFIFLAKTSQLEKGLESPSFSIPLIGFVFAHQWPSSYLCQTSLKNLNSH